MCLAGFAMMERLPFTRACKLRAESAAVARRCAPAPPTAPSHPAPAQSLLRGDDQLIRLKDTEPLWGDSIRTPSATGSDAALLGAPSAR
jgi:hypothetical protein